MTYASTARLRTLELKKNVKLKGEGCVLVKLFCRLTDAPAQKEPKAQAPKKRTSPFISQLSVVAVFSMLAMPVAMYGEYQNASSPVHKTLKPYLVQVGIVVPGQN